MIASSDSQCRLKSEVGFPVIHSIVSGEGPECHLPFLFTENEGEEIEVLEEFTNDSIE